MRPASSALSPRGGGMEQRRADSTIDSSAISKNIHIVHLFPLARGRIDPAKLCSYLSPLYPEENIEVSSGRRSPLRPSHRKASARGP